MDVTTVTVPGALFRLLRCEVCPTSFQTREGKSEHMRTRHAGRRSE